MGGLLSAGPAQPQLLLLQEVIVAWRLLLRKRNVLQDLISAGLPAAATQRNIDYVSELVVAVGAGT